jgi:hypothetical protein
MKAQYPGLTFISDGIASPIDKSKREFLRAAAVLLASLNLPYSSLAGPGRHGAGSSNA